jgi:hypothetical protein
MTRRRGSGRRRTGPHEYRDPRWNAERRSGVEIGEYSGPVRAPRRVLQRLLPARPITERCVEAY